MNGIGFAGAVDAVKVVSIKDEPFFGFNHSYLGVEVNGFSADLIGMQPVIEFHAGDVNVEVNQATSTNPLDADIFGGPDKLDWSTLQTTGMEIASLDVSSAVDFRAEGKVAMDIASGVFGFLTSASVIA